MPPLFVYAIAFLVVLTIITFVLCHRADAGEKAQAAPAGAPAAPERPSPRPAPAGAERPAGHAPLRRIDAPAIESAPAGHEAHVGGAYAYASAPAGSRGADAGSAHASPFVPASRGAVTGRAAAPAQASVEAAAIDLLGLQLAELTRQVAELQAERQAVRDEIRRLGATVADLTAPAPVRPLRPVRLVETEPRRQRIGG